MKYGAFWIICESIEDLSKGRFEILSYFEPPLNESDSSDKTMRYVAKHQLRASHKELWEQLRQERKSIRRFAYHYFPRGRVEFSARPRESTARIYLNPILDMPQVIDKIIETFELVEKIQVHRDGSGHYKCFLDKK